MRTSHSSAVAAKVPHNPSQRFNLRVDTCVVTRRVPAPEQIERAIHLVRGHRVLVDVDLAKLYGVTTGALNQAVRRNAERFPDDFAFQLTADEAANLKSQIVIPSRGGRRTSPWVFTEHGVAMLSSVLRSEVAAKTNIQIMPAFVRLRRPCWRMARGVRVRWTLGGASPCRS